MMIDTEVRHVTEPGTNLFLDLGFQADEAARLWAESKNQIIQAQADSSAVNSTRVNGSSLAGTPAWLESAKRRGPARAQRLGKPGLPTGAKKNGRGGKIAEA